MGKLIRIGDSIIQKDAILSARLRSVDYPFITHHSSFSTKAYDHSFKMASTRVLELNIVSEGSAEAIWLYDDKDADFYENIGDMIETHENTNVRLMSSYGGSKYAWAVKDFMNGGFTSLYPAGQDLDSLLDTLTED